MSDERDAKIAELEEALRISARENAALTLECEARLQAIVRSVHLAEHYKHAVQRISDSRAGAFRDTARSALEQGAAVSFSPAIMEAVRVREVLVAARAVATQPMLVKGDAATWGDVAESQVNGGRLLAKLMQAVAALDAPSQDAASEECK